MKIKILLITIFVFFTLQSVKSQEVPKWLLYKGGIFISGNYNMPQNYFEPISFTGIVGITGAIGIIWAERISTNISLNYGLNTTCFIYKEIIVGNLSFSPLSYNFYKKSLKNKKNKLLMSLEPIIFSFNFVNNPFKLYNSLSFGLQLSINAFSKTY